jgi:iron complex outermembrane receptor protein
MKFLLFVVFLIIVPLVSSGFGTEITGRVVDQSDQPIENVNIRTNLASVYAVTDAEGRFTLVFGDKQPEYLTFSHVSYQPWMILTSAYREDMKIMLIPAVYPEQNIRVTAMRAQTGLTPVAFSDFTAEEIERDYTIADFPRLLETTPNMYSFSYTGGAMGASEYKIRGFDSKRIGVYINGIPLNDPEDHMTYFYDLPDFAAEVSDIQVQRGVGNSLYGDASFGGSINIASAGLNRSRKLTVTTGYGRFYAGNNFIREMRKQSIEYSSGLLMGRWMVAGRLSKIYSGGYRNFSWYDGWSYFLSLSRLDRNMTTIINAYGGPFKAHLAFYGIDRETMKKNRLFNWSDYENEIDDFNQPHFELHNTYKFNNNLIFNNTLYYIRGEGYYEGYKYEKDNYEYNIPDSLLIDINQEETDLIRQKWVAKNHFGWNPRLDIKHGDGELKIGGAFYYFDSEHWGEVIWGENLVLNSDYRYYEYFGKKYSASVYAVEAYSLTEKLHLLANLQLRYLKYEFEMPANGVYVGYTYDFDWLFFSPRLGLTYRLNDQTSLFGNIALSSREPEDGVIYDADYPYAKPAIDGDGNLLADTERLYDFELGGNWRNDYFEFGANLFWMEFENEIVMAVGLDEEWRPLLSNADRSVHTGVEFEGTWKANNYLSFTGNAAYNHNRYKDYILESDTDWDSVIDQLNDYSDKVIPGFPEYIANLIFDLNNFPHSRLVFRLRMVGKQYIDNENVEGNAIEPYTTASLSGTVLLGKIKNLGKLFLSARIDNIFNEKYELAGVVDEGWAYYIPAAERTIYMQLKWQLE